METSYQEILRSHLEKRVRANPNYSLRSFARDLELAPSTLSEVLKGKKGLSPVKAEKTARLLRLPEWQASYFTGLVAKSHARGEKERKAAEASLKKQLPLLRVQHLKSEAVKALTNPLDLAILECTYLRDFEPSEKWCAKRLGVSVSQVRATVARLKTAKLLAIDENGGWKDLSPFFTSTDGISSEDIRTFHKSVIESMKVKLDTESVGERTMKSVVFSLCDSDLREARDILDAAMAKVMELAAKSAESKDHILCFSSQLFFLSKGQI